MANDLTITGSIGVIMSTWNYRGLMDKVGLRPETFKSGKYKDMLSGSREPDSITEEEREMVQALIDGDLWEVQNVVATAERRRRRKEQGRRPRPGRGLGGLRRWPHPVRHRGLQAGLYG